MEDYEGPLHKEPWSARGPELMAAKPISAHQPPDLLSLCLAITEHAPLPMALVEGASHIVRYANPAFCRLLDKPSEQLVGIPFSEMLPESDECVTLLDRVFRTGKPESHTEQEHSKPHPVFWSFTMWPVLADERPVGVMIQVTETAQFHEKTLAMNEALLLGSLRQHELTEVADSLNVQLQSEITERKLVEAEQKKLGQRLRDLQFYTRSLIESNIDALMTTDPSGIITDVNKQMEALTGRTRDELIGAPFKSHFTDPKRAEAAIKLVLRERKVTDYELTARARDGKQTVVSYNATTFYDRGRKLQGVFAAARDVTERKEDEAQLRFLMRELFHRSKNLLAVIQAIARQTARYSGSAESFLEKFNARLQALAMSHDILFKEEGQSASLADLVGQQLAPYLDSRESQVSVEGPTVLLKPDAAQNLGFALHELATNAAKYGALSVPEGRVSIAWRLLPEAGGNGVELDWVESCGPAVVKPTHRGFGSMVIERNLARELDTQVELSFPAEGVQCKILLPPGQLAAIR
jgi:PAS domain S-box-containing protein